MNFGVYPRRGNVRVFGLILLAILALCVIILNMRGTVKVHEYINIKPNLPPTGTPIRAVVKAELGSLQIDEVINIEFKFAGFPDKACSVTLVLNKEKPDTEQAINLPCQATYEYTIQSTSRVLVNGIVVQGNGNGQGSLVFKGDEALFYRRVVTAEPVRYPGPNGQLIWTMPYRASLNPDAPSKQDVEKEKADAMAIKVADKKEATLTNLAGRWKGTLTQKNGFVAQLELDLVHNGDTVSGRAERKFEDAFAKTRINGTVARGEVDLKEVGFTETPKSTKKVKWETVRAKLKISTVGVSTVLEGQWFPTANEKIIGGTIFLERDESKR